MFKLFKSFNKKDLVLIITCISLVALHVWLELRIPDYMSQITQLVQTEGSKMSAIIEQGSFMIICAFASLICNIVVGYFAAKIASKFSAKTRKRIFEKVENMGVAEIKKFSTSSLITRTTNDVNMSNSERAHIANHAKADIFIRIHANSSSSSSAKGVLTMCQTEKNKYNGYLQQESYRLSKLVVDNISKSTGANNRGVTQTDNMSGINWCIVPTTIVEMGFLSNPEEDKVMETQEYQKKVVEGIIKGVEEYFVE